MFQRSKPSRRNLLVSTAALATGVCSLTAVHADDDAPAEVELKDLANQLSAATFWEVSIKVSLGKLTLSLPYRQWMTKAIARLYRF